jgi:DNA adenine methylase
MDFYRFVAKSPDRLAQELATYPLSEDFYYVLRSQSAEGMSQLEVAARFLYLNRFCFNGVYRTNRKGQFNVPYGSKTGQLPSKERLHAASTKLRKTKLISGDFESTLSTVQRGDFVYLDPPYSASRNRGEYGYGAFAAEDVKRISEAAERMDRAGATFLISYKSEPEVSKYFANWHQRRVRVTRHVSGFAGSRGEVEELLISNQKFNEG